MSLIIIVIIIAFIALIAEMFYAWVQAKNEAEVEKAEKKKQAIRHYKLRMKAKVMKSWKVNSKATASVMAK